MEVCLDIGLSTLRKPLCAEAAALDSCFEMIWRLGISILSCFYNAQANLLRLSGSGTLLSADSSRFSFSPG